MGKPVNSDVKRVETAPLNTKVNKEVLNEFRDCCSNLGYPMNVMLEVFMLQYSNGRFKLSSEDILQFKNDGSELDTLSTTFSKEIYTNFKLTCKVNGYFVKHVLTAFMDKFVKDGLILEYINVVEEDENET